MNPGMIWLVATVLSVLAVAIGVPLLTHRLREWDFRAQVSGKKPERTLPEDAPVSYDAPRTADPAVESMKEIAALKSRQNVLGPK